LHSNSFISVAESNSLLKLLASLDAHAAHSSIVLSGLVCSLIFFEEDIARTQANRFWSAAILMISLAIAASLLRPEFKISKIYATPAWCFYSAAICIGVFGFLYWLMDLQRLQNWMMIVRPAAINPLICYLLPFVIESLLGLFEMSSPLRVFEGNLGMLAALLYASMIMLLLHGLNKANIKLKF
jgi:heparan-alpha-glucosaminide N-acetyltransferase